MPPSSNKLYAPVRGRLVKSAEGRMYDIKVKHYGIINHREIDAITTNLFLTKLIHVETIFVFHKDRVIGQKGQIKKIDASNGIKSVHDGLSRLIGLDDSYFVDGAFSKVTCDKIEDEQVIIKIYPSELLKYEDLLSQL